MQSSHLLMTPLSPDLLYSFHFGNLRLNENQTQVHFFHLFYLKKLGHIRHQDLEIKNLRISKVKWVSASVQLKINKLASYITMVGMMSKGVLFLNVLSFISLLPLSTGETTIELRLSSNLTNLDSHFWLTFSSSGGYSLNSVIALDLSGGSLLQVQCIKKAGA